MYIGTERTEVRRPWWTMDKGEVFKYLNGTIDTLSDDDSERRDEKIVHERL